MEHGAKLNLFLRGWWLKWEIMAVNTPPPSLNFCSSSSKAKAEARWIRSCINAHTLQIPCSQQITLTICTLNKLAHTLISGRWCLLAFHPSSWAVERLNNLYRNISCFLFRFLSRNILQVFKKWFKIPQWYSQVAQGVWSHRGRKFDHLLPTLMLICGVLGRKSVAYLGYLCCRAEEWFARGWYLIKSRSYGR